MEPWEASIEMGFLREGWRKRRCSAPAQGVLAEGTHQGELSGARCALQHPAVARSFEQTHCAARTGSSQTCAVSQNVLRWQLFGNIYNKLKKHPLALQVWPCCFRNLNPSLDFTLLSLSSCCSCPCSCHRSLSSTAHHFSYKTHYF